MFNAYIPSLMAKMIILENLHLAVHILSDVLVLVLPFIFLFIVLLMPMEHCIPDTD
jgi:hypothetical protein